MRILITGGAGFIGHNLTRAALEAGHDVRVLDDLSTGFESNLEGLAAEFCYGSVLDTDAVSASMLGIDSVIHLAGLGSVPQSLVAPLANHAANATGTLNLLEGARACGVTHVVTASSSSVYGSNPAMPKGEREWVRPISPYAVSKLAAEQYTLAYQEAFGFESLAFRFFNVYGPGQRAGHVYAAVIPTFIDAILAGKPVPLHGTGTQTRDFTHVGTVCRVLLRAAERRVSYVEPVNLAYGTNTSLLTVLEHLRSLTSIEFELDRQPSRVGDVAHSQASNERLTSLFPEVEPTELDQGLKETVEWFMSR